MVSQILALISRKVSYFDRTCLGWGYEQFERLKDIIMNILMGTSITAKYENCVEVSIQEMFDKANNVDLKDLTLKCKNEAFEGVIQEMELHPIFNHQGRQFIPTTLQ